MSAGSPAPPARLAWRWTCTACGESAVVDSPVCFPFVSHGCRAASEFVFLIDRGEA